MKKTLIAFLATILLVQVKAWAKDPYVDINSTMCEKNEDIYISCAFNSNSDEYSYDGKVASVCARFNTSPESGYVQFRYGKPSYGAGQPQVEMQYPENKAPPKGMFVIYTSINSETIGSALRFINGEYLYSFENLTSFGYKIIATKKNKEAFNKKCTLPGLNYLTDDAYKGIQTVELGETKISNANRCSGIGLREAYRSMDVDRVNACIVYTKTNSQAEGKPSREPDGISIYSVALSGTPKFVYEFPYAGTEGRIIDAFFLPAKGGVEEMLFVIHRLEAPKSWDSASDVYNVSVLKREGDTLLLDQKRTRFFDLGGDTVDEYGHPTYTYPYKDKKSIETAIASPLFHTVAADEKVTGTIMEKTFLHGGDSEPLPQHSSKMYLIKGDLVLVEDTTAGWCRVSYQTKVKTIKRWAQCKSINFSGNR
jgi:hypothetical protein